MKIKFRLPNTSYHTEVWLFVLVVAIASAVFPCCGPSKEEIEYNKKQEEIQLQCKSKEHQTTLVQGTYGCANYTMLKYYDTQGCEYIGHITNSSSDYIAHSGDCKKCYKKDSLLMVSILKNFFQPKH